MARTKCKQCGNCCKGIRLNFEPEGILKELFEEITEAEAFKIHPIFKVFTEANAKYYNCKMLIDNKCSIHKNKPQICKDYPIDGHSVKDIDCGYFNKDDLLDLKLGLYNKILKEYGEDFVDSLVKIAKKREGLSN